MAFNADCSWDAVSGVDGYNVYLSDDGGSSFTKQNGSLIATTSYTINDLEDGDYQAYVTSVLSGLESQPSNVDSFEVSSSNEVFTDFSEYTTGQQPSDWTAYGGSWEVVEDVDAEGGKILREATLSFSTYLYLIWDKIGNLSDVEILIKARWNNSHSSVRVWGSLAFNDEDNNYAAGLRDNDSLEAMSYIGGSYTQYAWVDKEILSANFWINVRFRKEGDSFKAKLWEYANSEPASWDAEWTDSEISSGGVGISKRYHIVDFDTITVTPL